MDDFFRNRIYDNVPEVGSVTADGDDVRTLLSHGDSFDILYREENVQWGNEDVVEEGISSTQAVNHFLRNASDFDRFSVSRDPLGNLNSITLYEKKYDGIFGKLWPGRKDEMIFRYRED